MYLNALKFTHLLLGLLAMALYLVAPKLLPAIYPDVFPATNAVAFYTQSPSLLLLLATAGISLTTAHNWQGQTPRALQVLASLLLIAGTVLAIAGSYGRLSVNPALSGLPALAVFLTLAGTLLPLLCKRARTAVSDDYGYDDEDEGREVGTVKWFNVSKGFGFITRDQGDDIFVHYRAIRGEGHRTLSEGQRVSFIVADKEKGLQAEDVTSA